jgi:hypothetical protein
MAADFGLWFGKSIFHGALAEVVQKDHLEHATVAFIVRETSFSIPQDVS